MKKYIIWTPSLKLNSGGVTLLHLLASMIKKLGYEAYVWPGDHNFEVFITNAKYNISLANKDMLNDDAIVVYPEITIGNPLKAKNVVRWLLNKPGQLGGDGKFGKEDIIFYLSDAFTDGKKNVNYLKIMELYGNMFIDRGLERKGSCYVMRKGKGRRIIHELSNSVEITDSTPSEELVRIFNEKKFFYCYDYASFLSLQAALCGCISVVIPFEGVSAEDWLGFSKTRKYGIAYGEENIEHAVMTMDKARPLLESLEDEFLQNVKNFIIKTQKWAKSEDIESFHSQISTISEFRNNETLISEAEKLIEEEELNRAKEILIEIIDEDQSNIKALNYLATITILEKKYKEAKKIINKILQIDETNITAKDNYEYLNEIVFQNVKEKELL